ncbi:hypothetical protein [[Mycobacterium] fortunisiensis]|uniref:hypothetical protein n=1 Tax=[Mycobacterium] fortunisiensis TaxID=2600579 RepID=UPI00355819A1
MSDTDMGPDDTLSPSESTDSDELANADGDEVVDPPEEWHGADRAEEDETLDRKLAAEEPEQPAGGRRRDEGDEGDESFYSVVP